MSQTKIIEHSPYTPISDHNQFFPQELYINFEEWTEINIPINQITRNNIKRSIYDNFSQQTENMSVQMSIGKKNCMQDRFFYYTYPTNNNKEDRVFAVLDGHGKSEEIVEFLANNLHQYILQNPNYSIDPATCLKQVFDQIDQHVLSQPKFNADNNGSVVLCGIIKGNNLYLANLGDCKAILISKDKYTIMTQDHTPERADESKRIQELGGVILKKRVGGEINVSRAIGDKYYKPYISSEPEITYHQLTDNDLYLILGTDGFWNEIQIEYVAKFVMDQQSNENIACKLYEQIMRCKEILDDNLTVLCLNIQKQSTQQ